MMQYMWRICGDDALQLIHCILCFIIVLRDFEPNWGTIIHIENRHSCITGRSDSPSPQSCFRELFLKSHCLEMTWGIEWDCHEFQIWWMWAQGCHSITDMDEHWLHSVWLLHVPDSAAVHPVPIKSSPHMQGFIVFYYIKYLLISFGLFHGRKKHFSSFEVVCL